MRAEGIRSWSAGVVALVENGRQRADRLQDLVALCSVFRVPLAELLQGNEDIRVDWNEISLSEVRQALDGTLTSPTVQPPRKSSAGDLQKMARRTGLSPVDLILATVFATEGQTWDFGQWRDDIGGIDGMPPLNSALSTARRLATNEILAKLADMLHRYRIEWIREQAKPLLIQLLIGDQVIPPDIRPFIDKALQEEETA